MIEYLLYIIGVELIIYLAIKIIYWFEYTNSYIHCHCATEPYKPGADNEITFSIDLDEEQSRELLKQFEERDND